MDIITKINEKAESLKEQDLNEWIIPELMIFYQPKIDSHAQRVYGSVSGNVARNSFRETAKATLYNGLNTFLFKSQHWQSGRDINTYLLTCLKRLADQVFWDQSSAKRAYILVCPGCRELGVKMFLVSESRVWRCTNCTTEYDRLADDIKKNKNAANIVSLRARMQFHKIFALHSRRGYRCGEPSCSRFIPETLNGKFGIQCPYPDCDFFGKVDELQVMSHPSALTHRQMVSLNKPMNCVGGEGSTSELQDFFKAEELPTDEKIVLEQSFKNEYSILLSVIDQQITSVKRTNSNVTKIQKLLMYEAFKSMCKKNPEEMVSYLVHLKQNTDIPIQVRIFQEYISLIEDILPFTIEKDGNKIDIISINDPYLSLFTGLSVFDAVVKNDGSIPNNTVETYTGSRKYKMFGPCFLGKLIDIVNKSTGKSIMDNIKGYSFVQIESSLPPGTIVTVSHYRIPSHYEMGSLVHLQRIRRHLVDKIYFRLHGKKRVIGLNEVK